MSKFRIALLQLQATYNQDESLSKGIEYCRKAKKLHADMVVFPEMWNMGYEMLFNGELKNHINIPDSQIKTWYDKAISNDSDFIKKYIELAKKEKIAVALTYMERTNEKPKNTVIIIDKNGNIILKYSKVHTVDYKMESYLQPGNTFETCILDYGHGTVKLGAMICFDRDFPESARILMLKGSEIIIVPNACYMNKIRLEQLKVRAYENMVGIVCVNYANMGGKSSAFSPIVKDKNKNEIDNTLLIMNDEENIKVVEYNMNSIRKYRAKEPLGDCYRKPLSYKLLIANTPHEPFIRNDSRRN